MDNTKCGCLNCRGQKIPSTHWGWKALRNKHGVGIGVCRKPGAKKGATKRRS